MCIIFGMKCSSKQLCNEPRLYVWYICLSILERTQMRCLRHVVIDVLFSCLAALVYDSMTAAARHPWRLEKICTRQNIPPEKNIRVPLVLNQPARKKGRGRNYKQPWLQLHISSRWAISVADYWADSRFASSQWKTALLCNDVSQDGVTL